MKVASLVHREVVSCSVHATLEDAAKLMWDHDVGCLPVIDDRGHLIGVVTDRDVCMAAYTQGAPLRAIPVRSAMASRVRSCALTDDVEEVERTMSEHQIRRMPVIDHQGHPVGLVSLNDLARAAALGKLPVTEVAATLAAIGAPRTSRVSAS